MKKSDIKFNLQTFILKESDYYVAYVPALDLSSCGKSKQEARKMIKQAIDIFFEEVVKKETLESVLRELGWTRKKSNWNPPMVVSQELQSVIV